MAGGALLVLCGSAALGQASETPAEAGPLAVANEVLKTCLQRHYEPAHDDMASYRSGDELMAACRSDWDAAVSACAGQPGKTRASCEAQTKMMLLGFVPMH